jgi:hypothetical protein
LERLSERTSISPQTLCSILDNNECVYLGRTPDNDRISKLFFSTSDDKFFVAIQDVESGYVVTILTIEYWQNLSLKYLKRNIKVGKSDLLNTIRIGDPSNKILKHPPIIKNKKINFSLLVDLKNNPNKTYKFVNGGSMEINFFYEKSTEDLLSIFKLQFNERLCEKGFVEDDISVIRWGLGKDLKINEFIIYNSIDYLILINSVKNDIYLRNNLIKKYDDLLQLLNKEN